ncbi:MAG: AAA family ATPase [Eisenbergiella sp.]
MYCILVTGIPASGKSTMARFLAEAFGLPVISKDRIKECMYDTIGFRSREEKVKLGTASMQIMYDLAEELMRSARPFILENNFENVSKEGLLTILEKYEYKAITVTLTGDYKIIYQRFLERNRDPGRHPGHVVNDCYPGSKEINNPVQISYESFVEGITQRGMDSFTANGPQVILDTTDFGRLDREDLVRRIQDIVQAVLSICSTLSETLK